MPIDRSCSTLSERHLAARELASQGFRIIPIVPGNKVPLEKDWHANALTTAEQVDAYFELHGDCNIAICPEDRGLCVVDIDPEADTSELELPETYKVRTPRGGWHLYYRGSLPPTVGRLTKHVDTRGQRSYVLIAPSTVNGSGYVLEDDRPPAPLPESLAAAVKRTNDAAAAREDVALDSPTDINSARSLLRSYVKRGFVSVQGSGGNHRAYEVAVKLVRDYGLTAPIALNLMLEEWNDACVPPWSSDELVVIVTNALKYGQNEPGAFSTLPAEQTFASALEKLAATSATEKVSGKTDDLRKHLLEKFRPVSASEAASRPPAKFWDEANTFVRLPSGSVTMVYGRTSVHKTGIVLANCLEFVLTHPSKPRVAYFIGEGNDMFGRRTAAICEHLGYRVEELGLDRWQQFDSTPNFMSGDEIEIVQERLDALWPDIIVIDTLTTALAGQNLSASEVMTRAFAIAQHFAKRYRASVIVVHHGSKDEDRGAFGSALFPGLVDGNLQLSLMPEKAGAPQAIKLFVEKMRDGKAQFSVFYKVQIRRYRDADVPVVEQIKAPGEVHALQQREEKKSSRDGTKHIVGLIARALYELKAVGDPRERGATTEMVAERIAANGFPGRQPPNRSDAEEWRRYEEAVTEWIEKLDNGARKRGDTPPRFAGYSELVLLPGVKRGPGKRVRRWSLPQGYELPSETNRLLG